MARAQRKTIIAKGDKRKVIASEYEAAKMLGVSTTSIKLAKMAGTEVKGWRIYDTPDRILERIAELEEQIKLLED